MASDADELLEVLDDAGAPTGARKRRADVHRDGDWHRAFHLWVVHDDGFVLLQRRASAKDLAAGKVDVSVAGHVRPGETLREMVREADEEIGLSARPGDLVFLETIRSERTYEEGQVDRELQDVYALVVPARPLAEYTLRCDEVSVLYEAPVARVVELYRDGTPVAVAGWDCAQRRNDALLVPDDLIAPARAATLASLERLQAWWELGGGGDGW
jgi:isopentenyldiphosphate isomerase